MFSMYRTLYSISTDTLYYRVSVAALNPGGQRLTKFECELGREHIELQVCRLGQLSSILREETFDANLYANQLARGNS